MKPMERGERINAPVARGFEIGARHESIYAMEDGSIDGRIVVNLR
jgi:hypothetical protein